MTKKQKFQVTIGADPELFIVDQEGRPVPSCGMIGAKKGQPKGLAYVPLEDYLNAKVPKLEENASRIEIQRFDKAQSAVVLATSLRRMLPDGPPSPSYGGVVEDNVMVEFNPAAQDSADRLLYGMWNSLASFEREYLAPRGLKYSSASELTFDESLKKYPQAMEFGCEPDRCVYLGGMRPPIAAGKLGFTRFAGGHVHIGYDLTNSQLTPDDVAVLCDVTMGLYGTVHDTRSPERRKFYGQAGLYRPKPYGLEYRTLSNFWLDEVGHTVRVLSLAHLVGQIASTCTSKDVYEFLNQVSLMSIKEAINAGDTGSAAELMEQVMKSRDLLDPLAGLHYSRGNYGPRFDSLSLVA